jgi:hypothetical protein
MRLTNSFPTNLTSAYDISIPIVTLSRQYSPSHSTTFRMDLLPSSCGTQNGQKALQYTVFSSVYDGLVVPDNIPPEPTEKKEMPCVWKQKAVCCECI